jgi:DNA-directed RNA polymerase specialized sigma24 family protein
MFNPDCYLPSESFFMRYEKALMELPDDDLFIWLMHRAGKSQEWIADKLSLSQSTVSLRIRKIEHYFVRRVTRNGAAGNGRIRKT